MFSIPLSYLSSTSSAHTRSTWWFVAVDNSHRFSCYNLYASNFLLMIRLGRRSLRLHTNLFTIQKKEINAAQLIATDKKTEKETGNFRWTSCKRLEKKTPRRTLVATNFIVCWTFFGFCRHKQTFLRNRFICVSFGEQQLHFGHCIFIGIVSNASLKFTWNHVVISQIGALDGTQTCLRKQLFRYFNETSHKL